MPDVTAKAIGERIRRLRRAQSLTARDLADACQIGLHQLLRHERGAAAPSATRLANIAAALNAPVAYFYGEADVSVSITPDPPLAQRLTP